MADYHDATGAEITLCDPPIDTTWYCFHQGVLWLVNSPGYDAEAPDCIYNFTVSGPTKPESFGNLDTEVDASLDRSPYGMRAFEAGIMAKMWKELAGKEEDKAKRILFRENSAGETAEFRSFCVEMRQWLRGQRTPGRTLRPDF